jgi:hypothetical protein
MLTRIPIAALLAVAAFSTASPAHAGNAERCEAKLERLEARFRLIEERRGYDAATLWWNQHGWPKYYARCGG